MQLLCIEAAVSGREPVSALLKKHLFDIDKTPLGATALEMAAAHPYVMIVISGEPSDMNALTLIRSLRLADSSTPILLISASSSEKDAIAALDAGADDYLRLPLPEGELLARIRALLRRSGVLQSEMLRVGDLVLDAGQVCLSCGNQHVYLSKMEFRVMELLMRHPGISFSTQHLLDTLWPSEKSVEPGTVWVYMTYLRRKLEALGSHCSIRCKRGVGYSIAAPANAASVPGSPDTP